MNDEDMAECTFHPRLSDNTKRLVQSRTTNGKAFHERLYEVECSREMPCQNSQPSTFGQDAFERRYRSEQFRRELAALEEETLFKPDIPPHKSVRINVPVESKEQKMNKLVNWRQIHDAGIVAFRKYFNDFDMDGNRLFRPKTVRGPIKEVQRTVSFTDADETETLIVSAIL